jgi:hypothetical protein
MKNVYTLFIRQDGSMFLAYMPDLDAMTQGRSFYEVITMARDLPGTRSIVEELPEPMIWEATLETTVQNTDS